mmetsp:Transcript_85733/g.149682  ORF Transcript_85733/g.149682 Transcript_85733/m.149682 type:complete len:209 (-) Transcript_85733:585-1211(-)
MTLGEVLTPFSLEPPAAQLRTSGHIGLPRHLSLAMPKVLAPASFIPVAIRVLHDPTAIPHAILEFPCEPISVGIGDGAGTLPPGCLLRHVPCTAILFLGLLTGPQELDFHLWGHHFGNLVVVKIGLEGQAILCNGAPNPLPLLVLPLVDIPTAVGVGANPIHCVVGERTLVLVPIRKPHGPLPLHDASHEEPLVLCPILKFQEPSAVT